MTIVRCPLSLSLSLFSRRLQCVLPVLCACVSADSKLQIVSECVSVLMSMSDHPTLAQQLCSHHGETLSAATALLL